MAFRILNSTIIDDSRNIINAAAVGVGTTNPTSVLHVIGNTLATGIITASQFSSNVASGTAPISVASSTLVNNLNVQFLNSQPGSFYQIANNLTGTAPASVVTQSSGLTVSGNLNVSGNVTIGGTATQLNAQQLQINDRDITLGVTTDANNNDISTDITANHGGISIASTVGTPILTIPIDGVNNSPSTYKQIMWIRQGHYSGLGTDAWIFNYGVSIGNTSTVQNGSRLTVGAGFTVFDTYLDATDIRARNINVSGITTGGGFNATTGNTYQINGTSVLSNNTLGSGVVNSSLTSVGTLGSLNVTGTTTLGFVTATSAFVSGIVTTGTHNLITGNTYQINGTNVLTNNTLGSGVVNSSLTSVGTLGSLNVTGTTTLGFVTATSAFVSGIVTTGTHNLITGNTYQINGTNVLTNNTLGSGVVNSSLTSVGTLGQLSVTGVTTSGGVNVTTGNTYQINGTSVLSNNTLGSGVVNSSLTSVGTLGSLNVTGTTTLGFVTATSAFVSGATTSTSYFVGATQVLGTVGGLVSITGIQTVDATTRTTLETLLAFAPNQFNDLSVTGISTFTNGPVLIGSGTSTGTATQRLQVTGGGYISTSTGIGITNPTQLLDVGGNLRVRGGIYDANNNVGGASSVLTANGSGGWSWQPVSAIGGNTITVTDDTVSPQIRFPLFASGASASTSTQFIDTTSIVYNTSTNCLGIGSLLPTSRIDVIGDARFVGVVTATDFNSSSDRNLKDNIQVIENPIDKILQLNGVTFTWNETGKSSLGVIAQEVEEVIPELVSDTNPKSVNYNGLIGLLIECVKEQQKQIDELKNKLK